MRGVAFLKVSLLLSLVLSIAVIVAEARGGRRGGGSLGGLFGGWRKHKKPTSSVNTRRITNGSPMHTPLTQPTSGKYPISGLSSSAGSQMKTHGSYPKQQMPNGYNYYGSSAGAAHLPPGSSHYATASALPTGAIYYAQPPMSSSGGTGNFLVGMMAGHFLSRGLFGHHSHGMYGQQQQQQQQQVESGSNRIIIINNGYANETGNATETVQFNDTTATSTETFNSNREPAQTNENMEASLETSEGFSSSSEEGTTAQIPSEFNSPTYGIICIPLLLNETSPNDPNEIVQVEKTVCYPAPPPPPPTPIIHQTAGVGCITRIVSEIDPLDPTKTIETPVKDCSIASTEKPPKVAGEIEETTATTTTPNETETSTTKTLQK